MEKKQTPVNKFINKNIEIMIGFYNTAKAKVSYIDHNHAQKKRTITQFSQ